ncbi:hypothetical protein WR25_05425 [Diploscapter pachys]|uniref:Uncharacterized protein n=1 Tax=Diploscapter pachys TaxID=2018661 RepID=A0A2A2LKP0_9BILA|nr:hypothetical protein WR25_05425 [Diploscapter pachys]
MKGTSTDHLTTPEVLEDGRNGMESTRPSKKWTVRDCCIIIAIVLVAILLTVLIYFCLSASWSLSHFSKNILCLVINEVPLPVECNHTSPQQSEYDDEPSAN